jgi:PAS domain S-box-containing protein
VQGVKEQDETLQGLRDSEVSFHALVDAVQDYAIFRLDREGRVATWNSGARRIKGYFGGEILGRHFSCFYTPEEREAGKPQEQLRKAAEFGRTQDQGWLVRKDGSKFWANVVLTALRDEHGQLQGFAKVTQDISELKHAEDALRRLSGRLMELQDQERRRLARELHDSIGQCLTAIKINLDVLSGEASDLNLSERARKGLHDAVTLVEQCFAETRTISYLLHPPLLDERGLSCAVQWYGDGFADRSGIKLSMELPEEGLRFPQPLETTLFRIVQECLTNIHRHSGSSTAAIRLQADREKLTLEVSDQGHGMAATELDRCNGSSRVLGVGIAGMRERVRQLGGRLVIDSSPRGTVVRAILPLGGTS